MNFTNKERRNSNKEETTMNPNKLNTLLLITTIIGTLLSFICMFITERWYISAIMFIANLIAFFVAMDRRENLRKGWRV